MFKIFMLVVLLGGPFATAATQMSSDVVATACAKVGQPGYQPDPDDELPYLCQLPERVKKNVPELYFWSADQYEKWLRAFPTKPVSSLNLGKTAKESHAKANAYVLDPQACHFFSSISPSVQKNKVNLTDKRTKIVLDDKDLLDKCMDLKQEIQKNGLPACSVVEFAGHSTQSVGLDTVFGIDEKAGAKVLSPSAGALRELGQCLRSISKPGAVVVFSTCGGDKDLGGKGQTHFWPGKEPAQKELARLFQMPIISGIGFVDGTPEGGVVCDDGWHLSKI